jgi:preprotein translocase subunit SecG
VATTRTAKRGILSRRTLIVANAMVLISFALGYLLHPTW